MYRSWPILYHYTSGLCSQHNLLRAVNLHQTFFPSQYLVPGHCKSLHSNALWHCRGTSHIKMPFKSMLCGHPPLFKLQLCICPVHCRNKRAKSLLLKLTRYTTINKINELFMGNRNEAVCSAALQEGVDPSHTETPTVDWALLQTSCEMTYVECVIEKKKWSFINNHEEKLLIFLQVQLIVVLWPWDDW